LRRPLIKYILYSINEVKAVILHINFLPQSQPLPSLGFYHGATNYYELFMSQVERPMYVGVVIVDRPEASGQEQGGAVQE
jgi:hypothetical protein